MYCLDTNIVIDILRNDMKIKEKVQKINGKGGIFITTATLCELYKGAYVSKNTEHSLSLLHSFIEEVEIVGLEIESCREFGQLYQSLKKSGKMIPEMDLIIASIVKENDLVLVTRDKKHFVKTGVKVEEW